MGLKKAVIKPPRTPEKSDGGKKGVPKKARYPNTKKNIELGF